MRHEFESGEWVEYRPVTEMKHKHRTRLLKVTRASLPLDEDGELDKAVIKAEYRGMAVYNLDYSDSQLAALCALAVTAWSYPVPVPELTEDGYGVLHADSIGETDLELADVLEPHLRRLTRDPDPKAATTSASNGRSKATAASLKA
jgi:hypothetical protein